MQVVVVNCDKRREEYDEHLKKQSSKYLTIPFEAQDVSAKLEDMAEAANIPRASIFVNRKGY